jgi:hypothetical protein
VTYAKTALTAIGTVCALFFLPATQIILANDSFQVVGGWNWLTSVMFILFFFIAPTAILSWVLFSASAGSSRLLPGVESAVFGAVLALLWSQFYFYYGSRLLGEYLSASSARALLFAFIALGLFWLGVRTARQVATFMAFLSLLAPITVWLTSTLPTGVDQGGVAKVADTVRIPTPVFLVVLDGLALEPLLDPSGEQIDSGRFPTFARLSREWTWFDDATTNATATVLAQPMMFTGRLIESRASDSYSSSRTQSLLTVLRRSSDIHVYTFGQGLCYAGADLCAESATATNDVGKSVALNKAVFASWWEASVPVVLREIYPPLTNFESWRFDWNGPLGEGRDQRDAKHAILVKDQFDRFISASSTASSSSAFVMWTTLTHFPYVLDDRGDLRLTEERAFLPGMTEAQVRDTLGNYRSQIQYVDGLLGKWINALVGSGRYESASIIVTADHGISYGGNNFELDDRVTRVPFFAKLPGLSPGKHSRDVQTIDIAPTLFDVIGLRIGDVDGQSLLQSYKPRPKIVLKPNRVGVWVRTSGGSWIRYDSMSSVPRL